MNIKNKNLLINKCYLNGTWVSSNKKIKVINPATGELIVEVPDFGKKETVNAIDAAEHAFKTWSKFNHVTINFSIDDLAQRFEYQRKNAKWNEVLTNIRLYKEYGKKYRVNLELRLYTTVGILNIFYLKEFLEFMKQYEMKVMLNMVHYPHHFSVVNLPDSIKDIIKAKLQSIEDISILEKWSPTIENVINFMYGNKMDSVVYKRFFEKIAIHDEYRQESFRITFPEMSKLLEENEQT